MSINVEDVFKDTGIPTYTFVESKEYLRTKVALRTAGKGVIIEGPSGIGKTSCVKKAIEALGYENPTFLSPLIPNQKDRIEHIMNCPDDAGTVIIDDFHRLDEVTKHAFANILKIGADESRTDFKLILIGINQAGDSLVNLNREIINRIATIKFEQNPEEKVRELITKGEKVMNVSFKHKEDIVTASAGSFHVAQMLCQRMCIESGIDSSQSELTEITIPLGEVIKSLISEMDSAFGESIKTFARGNRNRSGGNRPYYKLLTFLSQSPAGTISMNDIKRQHQDLKGSIVQITEKKNDIGKSYIEQLIDRHEGIRNILFFDAVANSLTIEDPKVLFYLRNKDMIKLGKECGFNLETKTYPYEYAISFAGEQRDYAKALSEELTRLDVNTFYDNDHAAEILGTDVEEYLKPIYASESHYVVVFLDNYYPKKIWTAFESEQFSRRFGEDSVIPILIDDYQIDTTSQYYKRGFYRLDTTSDPWSQIKELAELLYKKAES